MIDERRLIEAKRLLLFTLRSVEDISLLNAGIPGERFSLGCSRAHVPIDTKLDCGSLVAFASYDLGRMRGCHR